MKKIILITGLIVATFALMSNKTSSPYTAATPRFSMLNNSYKIMTNIYAVSIINNGTANDTLRNKNGEIMIIAPNETLALGRYSSDVLIDQLTVYARGGTSKAKIIYF